MIFAFACSCFVSKLEQHRSLQAFSMIVQETRRLLTSSQVGVLSTDGHNEPFNLRLYARWEGF